MKIKKNPLLLTAPHKSARRLQALAASLLQALAASLLPVLAASLLATLLATLTLASESQAQQRNVWASGGSKGIWAAMRNGISEEGFKSNLRVRYQAGAGAEASLRLLEQKESSAKTLQKIPAGMLLAAEPYYIRALIEQKAQTSNIPIVLIGADTGSQSQPENVLAIVGIDAFATGKSAAQYAIRRAGLRNLLANESPSLCLRTRSDDPARARICRGIAAGLQKPVAMLNIAPKAKGKQKSLNTKLLQSYLKKNPQTPILWLDDGAFTQELLDALLDASRNALQAPPQAPLVVFGLDVSQKNIIEQNPQAIAFVVDLKPFQQGKRAMKILRDYLRVANKQTRATAREPAQIHSLTAKMLGSEEISKILPEIGRTR